MTAFLVPAGDDVLAQAKAAGLVVHAVTPKDPAPASWARALWLVSESESLLPFLANPGFCGGRLLLLTPVDAAWKPALAGAFISQLSPSSRINLVSTPELLAILGLPDAAGRAIAVAGDTRLGLTIWRGDLSVLTAPTTIFPAVADGPTPDFESPFISDRGQTVVLGAYEVALEGILDGLPHAHARQLAQTLPGRVAELGAF